MPTWGELLKIAQARSVTNPLALDSLRLEALQNLARLTGRPVVLYASRWLQGGIYTDRQSIVFEDVHALMEVLHGIPGPNLDLILHSPGGSPTATEAMVEYIRTRFSHVRVFVPLMAMSAATMLACAADEIVMGKHSFLGPIDPQVLVNSPHGGAEWVPAQAIIAQFNDFKADPRWNTLNGSYALLEKYGPGLIKQLQAQSDLSEELVVEWLLKFRFKGVEGAKEQAGKIAEALNSHEDHKVHGRCLSRDRLAQIGLETTPLEANQDLQDAVLTVLHAVTITFEGNPVVQKVVENHLGARKVSLVALQLEATPSKDGKAGEA